MTKWHDVYCLVTLAEIIAARTRQQTIATATNFSNKLKNPLEQERQNSIALDLFKTLFKKYARISDMQALKYKKHINSIRKGRKRYLQRQKKLSETRFLAEENDNKIRLGIFERITDKELCAKHIKFKEIEMQKRVFIEEHNRTIEVHKNHILLRKENEEYKRNLIERIQTKNQRTNDLMKKKNHIKTIIRNVTKEIEEKLKNRGWTILRKDRPIPSKKAKEALKITKAPPSVS